MRWISPLRLYLIFSVVYFGAASLASGRVLQIIDNSDNDPEATDVFRSLGFENERGLQDALSHARSTWAPRVMFLLVPLFAWLVRAAYRSSGRNYPQYLYFALHVHAAWFAAAAVVAAATLAVAPDAPWAVPALAALRGLLYLYGLVYGVLALRTAYGGTIGQTVLRAAALAAVYYIVIVATSVAVAMAVIFRPWSGG